jgi:hypothetical protein
MVPSGSQVRNVGPQVKPAMKLFVAVVRVLRDGLHPASLDIPMVWIHLVSMKESPKHVQSDFSLENKMKKIVPAVALALLATPLFAQVKPCEELKSEIAAKLDAKGVKDSSSRLAIVPTEEIKDQKVIGSCEAGKKKITYTVPSSSAPDQSGKAGAKP